eukprot:TRINITY_DN3978_c0_g1_i1.p1 TRINITY_DN3978_c0_g1~~TRINITY_DN3978_c0_g1_i1.p1  ORF type:complete len:909 (-),score=172.29 TRINITY_DN3978_c0_g1_i1:48-2774(-)
MAAAASPPAQPKGGSITPPAPHPAGPPPWAQQNNGRPGQGPPQLPGFFGPPLQVGGGGGFSPQALGPGWHPPVQVPPLTLDSAAAAAAAISGKSPMSPKPASAGRPQLPIHGFMQQGAPPWQLPPYPSARVAPPPGGSPTPPPAPVPGHGLTGPYAGPVRPVAGTAIGQLPAGQPQQPQQPQHDHLGPVPPHIDGPLRVVGLAPANVPAARAVAATREGAGADGFAAVLQQQQSERVDRCVQQAALRPGFAASAAEREKWRLELELRDLFARIDTAGKGHVSLFDFIGACQADQAIADVLAPSLVSTDLLSKDDAFDKLGDVFSDMAEGGKVVTFESLASYCRTQEVKGCFPTSNSADKLEPSDLSEVRLIFEKMDGQALEEVSKFDLIQAAQTNAQVRDFVQRYSNRSADVPSERTKMAVFDAASTFFDEVADGKGRFSFRDLVAYVANVLSTRVSINPSLATSNYQVQRSRHRVLIIQIGFGRVLNPPQTEVVEQAGFQVGWVQGLPNPETPGFPLASYAHQIKALIDEFQPHLLMAASKGSPYLAGLWQTGCWLGPSVMINVHPVCQRLPPQAASIVLCQGSHDEVYPCARAYLEGLMTSGTRNRCFLYYTADSGPLATGQLTRIGDTHNQGSLLHNDCLPRLMDAALAVDGCPEMAFIHSWRDRLSDDRLAAECRLGYLPQQLHRFWASEGRRGRDAQKLFEVAKDSEEYRSIVGVFKAVPKERASYCGENQADWDVRPILRIERVENGLQYEATTRPYLEAVKRSIHDQGLAFEPGMHTRWAFHGTDAIDAIVNNPLTGFQPLTAGRSRSSLWGAGTYFARDAKYVGEGGFCKRLPDGSYRMLMCLLITGMPCLGDPEHHGLLPARMGAQHRYNSSVDFLSNPEIFIVQHPGAAYPAYVITFA